MIRITFDPEPAKSGMPLKICYEFSGSGITSTTLDVSYVPPGTTSSHSVSQSDPCFFITCGAGDQIVVKDQSGISDDGIAEIK